MISGFNAGIGGNLDGTDSQFALLKTKKNKEMHLARKKRKALYNNLGRLYTKQWNIT